MTRAFTIIDSFRVPEARLDGLALGTWFVLDGSFQSAADLPAPGTSVVVLTPGGEQIRTSVVHVDVRRHGAGAVSFAPTPEQLPRLSTFSPAENGR